MGKMIQMKTTDKENQSQWVWVSSETDPEKPYINVAIHKADIDFSNDGIKAAAVSAVGGAGAAGPEYFDYSWDVPVEEIDLTFDKPFLFLIRDKLTGEVWFTGTVYNPHED